MKYRGFVIILLIVIIVSAMQGQFVFGVKPGLVGNGAQFGINLGGIMILGGLEYIRTTMSSEETGDRVNYYYSYNPPSYYYYYLKSEPYKNTYETSLNIYAPFLGVKILLGGGDGGKMGAYVTGFVSKPMLSGKSVSNGKESESYKKSLENISLWMFQAGFGAEYFFSDNFSIGGEFGLRALLVKQTDESSYTVTGLDQSGQQRNFQVSRKTTDDFGLGITYSTLVLNYYF